MMQKNKKQNPNKQTKQQRQQQQNSKTLDVQKTKSVVVNKTAKVKVYFTDYQSWNSCRRVTSDHEFTFGSATEPTKQNHNAL